MSNGSKGRVSVQHMAESRSCGSARRCRSVALRRGSRIVSSTELERRVWSAQTRVGFWWGMCLFASLHLAAGHTTPCSSRPAQKTHKKTALWAPRTLNWFQDAMQHDHCSLDSNIHTRLCCTSERFICWTWLHKSEEHTFDQSHWLCF